MTFFSISGYSTLLCLNTVPRIIRDRTGAMATMAITPKPVSYTHLRIRKNKRLVHLEDWEKADPRDAYRDKDHQIDLEREINRLKAKQQEVIRLRFFLDYDYKTISEITNTPLGTVKSRLYHGLRNLRKGLGGEYNG